MLQFSKRSFDQFHLVGLAVALVLLITVASLSYAGWQAYDQALQETREINNLIRTVQSVALDLEQAEVADRRFLLTGDRGLLTTYVRSREAVRKQEQLLRNSQAAGRPASAALARFESAVDDELSSLDAPLPRTPGRLSDSVMLADVRRQEDIMSRVTGFERAFELSRRSELGIRRDRTRYYARISQVTATLGCMCIFVIVFLSAIRIQNLIHMRARLNHDLAEMTNELRHLADSVPQLVWSMNESGEVEYLNQRWTEFSGEAVPETKAWQELLHPKDREGFLKELQESVKRRAGLTAECRLRSKVSGTFHWFLFRASPGRLDDSAAWKLYGTFTDINQLKRMELALQRANGDLEQFSYAAAHDLQEPLRNISNCLSLLRHTWQEQLDEESAQWMTEGVQNTERMRVMVKDLLTFSKAVGQWPVDYPVLNASDVLRDALANLSAFIGESGAEIAADQLPSVKIQRSHLLQIFQNLIGNSLKYRRRDVTARITVSAIRKEDEWIFSVGDNGIGFDSHYAQRIFGMFKRLHGKGEYAGTGIGLSICARIVAHYGGRIWAESQPGQGAIFRFALPVYDEESRNEFTDSELDSEKDLTAEATWRPGLERPHEIAS